MLTVRTAAQLTMCLLVIASVARGDELLPRSAKGTGDYATQWVSLPTDRETRGELPPTLMEPPRDLARLMRPRLRMAAEWEPNTDGVEIGNYDLKVTVPTFPIYGPPPPMLSAGFSFTDLTTPISLGLPASLYDFSLGAAWMRPLNERWMLRFIASAAFASDLNNTSSDAWQFRGGVLSTYKWSPDLQLIIGAFASGRDDIPVLPGVGAIWTPTPLWRVDLMMPRPRISYMLIHTGDREHWVFLGGGLSGGTWAFERDGLDDKLTYREFRFGLGWESVPPKVSLFMPGDGWKLNAELGYVFGRQFEFERRTGDMGIDGTLLLRVGAGY